MRASTPKCRAITEDTGAVGVHVGRLSRDLLVHRNLGRIPKLDLQRQLRDGSQSLLACPGGVANRTAAFASGVSTGRNGTTARSTVPRLTSITRSRTRLAHHRRITAVREETLLQPRLLITSKSSSFQRARGRSMTATSSTTTATSEVAGMPSNTAATTPHARRAPD